MLGRRTLFATIVEERTLEKRRRGLASVDAAKRRQIARKGGQAAHAQGTAHEFTPAEARAAGRKGGAARGKNRAQGAQGREGGGALNPRSVARREASSPPPPEHGRVGLPDPADGEAYGRYSHLLLRRRARPVCAQGRSREGRGGRITLPSSCAHVSLLTFSDHSPAAASAARCP